VTALVGRLSRTDRVLAGYCAGTALLAAVRGGALGARQWTLAGGHLLVAALAIAAAALDRGREGGASRFAHRWLPLVALAWLYGWAGEMRHLIVAADLDPVIERWDETLFPGHWHEVSARLPAAAVELAHAAYFSYYLILFVPALVVLAAGARRAREVDRYLFWLTLAMVAHYALNFLLPVAGPLGDRATLPAGVLFVPLMNAFYAGFDRGGLAFPSTHVVAAMIAAGFAGRIFFPGRALAYALWFGAIALSTVVCGYHYPIDVLAGLLSGALFCGAAGLTATRAKFR